MLELRMQLLVRANVALVATHTNLPVEEFRVAELLGVSPCENAPENVPLAPIEALENRATLAVRAPDTDVDPMT